MTFDDSEGQIVSFGQGLVHRSGRLRSRYGAAMRWDRLFADLEAAVDDDALLEREAMVAELRDEAWSRTPWRELLGGQVEVEVCGAGRLVGTVGLVNERLLRLDAGRLEHVVALAAVLGVRTDGRAPALTSVDARLGWNHVLRQMRDDGDEVLLVRVDGSSVRAQVEQVVDGGVLVRSAERTLLVPLQALAVVTVPR